MKTSHTILLGVGVILASTVYGSWRRAQELAAIFEQMTIRPNSMPKKIKLSLTQLSFDIDIRLTNPTGDDFAVTGYVATLKRIMVYFKGQLIGMANVDIDEISVPSNNIAILHDVNVVIGVRELTQNIAALLPQITGNMNLNDFAFTGVVEVMGSEYEIGN